MQVSNTIQTLTPEQQSRCYFAIVSTDQIMADGTRQNNARAQVRLRNGSMALVKDLPPISKDDPQPNGDYSISVCNNHSDDVADQSGVGWLWVANDGTMHMMYCLTTNDAANAVAPLARDNMLQFSTEGFCKDMSENGVYGDYWITAVAPVKTGNDPGTQSVENKIKDKDNNMTDEATKPTPALTKEQVEAIINNALKKNADTEDDDTDSGSVATKVAELIDALGIKDSKWIADIMSDFIKASAGEPYDGNTTGQSADQPADPNAPIATDTNSVKNGVKQVKLNGFKPQVKQEVAHVGAEDFGKKKKSPEYLEAWGRALMNGWQRPNADFGAEKPLQDYAKKNDIDLGTDVDLIPEVVISRISELLQSNNSILGKIEMLNGQEQYTVPAFVSSTNYAKGRARGRIKEKDNSTASITKRVLIPQTLYKFVTLPADMVDNNGGQSGSAIVDWVTRSLPSKVIRAAEEALIVGGVKNDDEASSDYDAIKSIVTDVTAPNSAYGSVYTPTAGESLLKSLNSAVPQIDLLDTNPDGTGIYLIISRTNARKLLSEAVLGNGQFPANLATSMSGVASFLGIDGVLEIPWLRPAAREAGQNPNIATFMSTYQALLVNLNGVVGVGELTPQALAQYFLRANSYDFESKLRIGAGLAKPYMATLIGNAPAAGGQSEPEA